MANGTEAISEKFLGFGGGTVLDLGIWGLLWDMDLILLLLGQDLYEWAFGCFCLIKKQFICIDFCPKGRERRNQGLFISAHILPSKKQRRKQNNHAFNRGFLLLSSSSFARSFLVAGLKNFWNAVINRLLGF